MNKSVTLEDRSVAKRKRLETALKRNLVRRKEQSQHRQKTTETQVKPKGDFHDNVR